MLTGKNKMANISLVNEEYLKDPDNELMCPVGIDVFLDQTRLTCSYNFCHCLLSFKNNVCF